MSPRTRLILAIIGSLIVLLSLALLIYVFWPLGSASRQFPLPSALFEPLLGAPFWPGGLP